MNNKTITKHEIKVEIATLQESMEYAYNLVDNDKLENVYLDLDHIKWLVGDLMTKINKTLNSDSKTLTRNNGTPTFEHIL